MTNDRDARGRWHATSTDRRSRQIRFLTERGQTTVEPANATEASKLGEYWNAVHRYLKTGDDGPLQRFERVRLQTTSNTSLPFLTDLTELERLGYAGELSFEDLYQS